jgi:hypothetical protein
VIFPKKANALYLYRDVISPSENATEELLYSGFENCTNFTPDADTNYQKSFDIDRRVLNMTGKNSRPCSSTMLSNLTNTVLNALDLNNYVNLKFDYLVAPTTTGQLCLKKINSQNCFLTRDLKKYTAFGSIDSLDILLSLGAEDFKQTQLFLILDSDKSGVSKDIEISNMSLTLGGAAAYSAVFDLNTDMYPLPADLKLAVNDGDIISIDHYYPNNSVLTATTINPRGGKSTRAVRCSNSDYQADYTSELSRVFGTDGSKDFLEYKADRSISCDSVLVTNILYNTGYINVLELNNIEGRALSYCLKTDPPGYCLVNDIPNIKKSQWTSLKYVVPPFAAREVNYSVLYNNYSVGKFDVRVNRVGDNSLYPIPYKWLKSIYEISPVAASNSAGVSTAHRILPFLYYAKPNGAQDVVVLGQGYDNAWVVVGSSEHFRFNGWGNAWKVNFSLFGDTVIILYWVQLLTFVGYLAVVLYMLILCKLPNFDKKADIAATLSTP